MSADRFAGHRASFDDCPRCQELVCEVYKRYGGWRWHMLREQRIREIDVLTADHHFMVSGPREPDGMPDARR